ncbi:MAG: dienelactone hydrolase family protein [Ramlibacter sp.]|nr:dienelactone hydrolase family protein [Ramlibacter sp.]
MSPDLHLPLDHLFRRAAPGTADPWLLVLMHGVGSNEEDLFGLAPAVPPQFHVLSLRAPHVLGPQAYAWFEFGVRPNGERVINEAQEAASRPLVAQTVTSAASQLGLPANRVVVGGFSQGGIMSLSLLLTQPQLLQAAMVMHSRLLPQVWPLVASPSALQGRKLWVSHGLQDNVIPLASAHDIRQKLASLPVELTYAEFPGAHEIRPSELRAAMTWLDSLRA